MDDSERSVSAIAVAAAAISLSVVLSFGVGMMVGVNIGSAHENPVAAASSGHASSGSPVTTVEWAIEGDEPMVESSEMEGSEEGEPPAIRLVRAWVQDDEVHVELDYDGFSPSVGGGMHAHVFRGSVDPVNAGAPGDASIGGGIWWVVDNDFWSISVDEWMGHGPDLGDGDGSGEVCVGLAMPGHTLASLDEVSCAPIEGL